MNIQENIEVAKKLIEEKQLDKALILLKDIFKESKADFTSSVIFEIGKIYYIKQEYDKAEKEFLKIKDVNDYRLYVYDFLVKIYYSQKRYDKIVNFSNILKQIGSLDLIKYLIYSLLNLNRYEESLSLIEDSKYKEIKDDLKKEIIDVYKNVINNFCEEKKYKECFIALQKLNERNSYIYVLNNIIKHVEMLNLNNEKEKIKEVYNSVYNNIPDIFKKEKNVLLNDYEISQGKIKLESYPIDFQITLTRKCNLRCIMCGVPYDNLNYSLSDKEIDEIIEIMPYLKNLTLQGGEVFFDNRISRILEASKKNNVCTKIITNGLLLKRDIIKTLVTMNVDLIISIDSCDKQNYEQIRIGAKFENLIENINLLNKMRKENDSKMNLTLAMVVMKRNYKEIENIIRFAKEYKFSAVTLSQIYGNLPDNEQNFFDFDVDYNIIKELDDKRIYFNNLAKQCSIVLQNKLPKFSDYDIKDIQDDNIEKEDKIYNVTNKKENSKEVSCNVDVKEKTDKSVKEVFAVNKEEVNKNVTKFNRHPLFCYRPFKAFFIDDCNFYPHCICAHSDEVINESRNTKFKNLNTNSILERWNSEYMQNYRAKIFEEKQVDVCTRRCLRTACINSI